MIDKQFLIDFETEVKERYEAGEIKAPVHLSSNNEEELIKIFKDVWIVLIRKTYIFHF